MNQIFDTFTFPDGQPHVRLLADELHFIMASIKSPNDLFYLGQAVNACHHQGINPMIVITYLMGARFDRVMQSGDSFDLEVVAGIINSFGEKGIKKDIYILDPHSHVATDLIENSNAVYNKALYSSINIDNGVLIVPDKGASAKTEIYQKYITGITDVVYCDKVRDIEGDGRITLSVRTPDICEGRECVIVDDICDGGGTFIAIANQIKPSKLSLCVTHGIFSKGLGVLSMFDKIYTTDSFTQLQSDNQLIIIKNDTSVITL